MPLVPIDAGSGSGSGSGVGSGSGEPPPKDKMALILGLLVGFLNIILLPLAVITLFPATKSAETPSTNMPAQASARTTFTCSPLSVGIRISRSTPLG